MWLITSLHKPLLWWCQSASRRSRRWPSSQWSSSAGCAACRCNLSQTAAADSDGRHTWRIISKQRTKKKTRQGEIITCDVVSIHSFEGFAFVSYHLPAHMWLWWVHFNEMCSKGISFWPTYGHGNVTVQIKMTEQILEQELKPWRLIDLKK